MTDETPTNTPDWRDISLMWDIVKLHEDKYKEAQGVLENRAHEVLDHIASQMFNLREENDWGHPQPEVPFYISGGPCFSDDWDGYKIILRESSQPGYPGYLTFIVILTQTGPLKIFINETNGSARKIMQVHWDTSAYLQELANRINHAIECDSVTYVPKRE